MKMVSRIYLVVFAVMVFVSGCKNSYLTTEQFVGVKYDILIKELGKPDSIDEFVYNYSDSLHEYQGNLYKILGDERNVMIKELWWNKPDKVTIVWFREFEDGWESIDGITYDPRHITF